MGKKKAISDAKLALYNRLQREKFRAVPADKRMLFLPHCLRKPQGCRADNTGDGLVCKHCSPDCSVNLLSSYAVKKGYKCYIVPGGEMLFNIVEREKPGAILGVACHHEMAQAAERLGGEESSVSFAYQGVPLSKSGCVDTKVDLVAVKSVLDLEGPPPGAAPASAAPFSFQRRRTFARVGGIAAAVTVALAAMFLILPGMLAPPAQGPGHSQPALTFFSDPFVQKYTKDETGTWAVVKASVANQGQAPARGVQVRATAYWCGVIVDEGKGSIQLSAVNGTLASGAKTDLTLMVKVHGQNDTSITVETLIGEQVAAVKVIKTPRPAFLRNAGVSSYETTLAGKVANVTVWVYNDRGIRPAGTLRVAAYSYSFNTRWDTAEAALDRTVYPGETWEFTVQLKVSGADPGHPSFAIELFEGQEASPSDYTYFAG